MFFNVKYCAHTSYHLPQSGRYGDPLNPDADLEAMARVRSILKPGGLLLLTVPVGPDVLVFNLHRRYGPARLPLLLGLHSTELSLLSPTLLAGAECKCMYAADQQSDSTDTCAGADAAQECTSTSNSEGKMMHTYIGSKIITRVLCSRDFGVKFPEFLYIYPLSGAKSLNAKVSF